MLAARTASGLSAVLPSRGGKLVRSLAARRTALRDIAEWGRARRDPSRPLVWVHAASVGEGLMARPVIRRLRERHPEMQTAYTFFSPSAEGLAAKMGTDVFGYLPFDTPVAARALISALRPTLLAFSKLDVWPLLVEKAVGHGIPVALISAAIESTSGRLSLLARAVLGDAYSALSAVGAVDSASAERLVELGVSRDRIALTGDTRYDQVWARLQDANNRDLVERLRSPRPTLVAGSTWPSDEAILLPAWERVVAELPAARLVIAAHEPNAAWVGAVEHWARSHGRTAAGLGSATADTDMVLVDRMGVLADLYAVGVAAYVGGGFHAAGLHSVVEPAAHGLPVLTGPRHHASRDAALLHAANACAAVDSVDTMATALRHLLADRADAAAAGARARAVVQGELGATDRSVALLEALLGPGQLRQAGAGA